MLSTTRRSDWHPLASLQQRLEITKHPWPSAATSRGVAATRDHAGDHRRSSDVVSQADRAYTTLVLGDLVGEARVRFRGAGCVEEGVPSLHELVWRITFNDLAHDHLVRHAHRLHLLTGPMGVAAASLQFVFYAATITIFLSPFRQSDRIPNCLSTCIDHNTVKLSFCRFVHSHRLTTTNSARYAALRNRSASSRIAALKVFRHSPGSKHFDRVLNLIAQRRVFPCGDVIKRRRASPLDGSILRDRPSSSMRYDSIPLTKVGQKVGENRKSPLTPWKPRTKNGEGGIPPTVRLPVQRFSSFKSLIPACVAPYLSVWSSSPNFLGDNVVPYSLIPSCAAWFVCNSVSKSSRSQWR